MKKALVWAFMALSVVACGKNSSSHDRDRVGPSGDFYGYQQNAQWPQAAPQMIIVRVAHHQRVQYSVTTQMDQRELETHLRQGKVQFNRGHDKVIHDQYPQQPQEQDLYFMQDPSLFEVDPEWGAPAKYEYNGLGYSDRGSQHRRNTQRRSSYQPRHPNQPRGYQRRSPQRRHSYQQPQHNYHYQNWDRYRYACSYKVGYYQYPYYCQQNYSHYYPQHWNYTNWAYQPCYYANNSYYYYKPYYNFVVSGVYYYAYISWW